ncbi:MAG: hypothetical protein EOO61_11305 [Hymenobacter sp.]|nr:MAG: hypothetical protein EOO61_11305 [Hymenobacter sp.]
MGLDTVELIYNLELHFAIRIPHEEAAKCTTVQDVYELVLRQLPAAPNPQKIYAEVVQFIAHQAGYEIHKIQPHRSLTNDLGLD